MASILVAFIAYFKYQKTNTNEMKSKETTIDGKNDEKVLNTSEKSANNTKP